MKRLSLAVSLALGFSSAASAAVSVQSPDCAATYTVVKQWNGGFNAEVTLTNRGAQTLDGWRGTWTFTGGEKVSSSWRSIPVAAGPSAELRNESYNGTLAAGKSVNFGFTGTGTPKDPKNFGLNGKSCEAGSPPPPPPPPPPAISTIRPLATAKLLYSYMLTPSAHVSDGSDREQNGVARFAGPMGAEGVTYKDYQYVAYYTGKNRSLPFSQQTSRVVVARRKLTSNTWERSTLQGHVMGTHFEDGHRRVGIAISKGDGVIHLTFDHHNEDHLNYAATAVGVADNPAATSWNDSVFTYKPNFGGNFTASQIGSVTYPAFISVPDGNLMLYLRDGGSNSGDMQVARYDAAVHRWVSIRKFSTRKGTYNGLSVDRGPYNSGLQADQNGKLQTGWVWREADPKCEANDRGKYCNHGLYYAYSPDQGATWFNSAGKLVADTAKGQTLSVNNIGGEVVVVPQNLEPSNTAINSAVDPATGNFHLFNSHKSNPSVAASMHHYIRDGKTGKWSGGASGFSGSDATLVFQGDYLFALLGRTSVGVYYSTRAGKFGDWKKMNLPSFGSPAISRGFTNWDFGRLNEGVATIIWQQESAGKTGTPSPVRVYDVRLADLIR